MKHFFILGNNPTLSIAELESVLALDSNLSLICDNIALSDKEIDAKDLIRRIGGTIKIGKIINEVKQINQADLNTLLLDKAVPGQKFLFGISYYGSGKLNTQKLGLEAKKFLKEKNLNARWVTSREKTLSSVVVEQNKLISKGAELVIIKNEDKYYLGKTEAVQPFKDLSFRDFGRPARDDYSGMLPPKLAQIMINLSHAKLDDVILDPFCGSGTILTEAILMGYKNLIGSDISEKAIKDTENNINWIQKKFIQNPISCTLKKINAQSLSQHFKPNSIDAIITETYLGPQRGKFDLQKTKQELEKLYQKSLLEMQKILKPGGCIVIALPLFKNSKGDIMLNRGIFSQFILQKPITPDQERRENQRQGPALSQLIYGRPDQKVWREIVVLKKAN